MVCACSIGMGFRSTPEQFSQHDDSLSSIEAAALLGTTTPHACISRCVFAVATWDRSSQRHNGDGGAPRRQGASAVRNYCRRAGNSSAHWCQCRSLPRCGARWHHPRSTRAPAHGAPMRSRLFSSRILDQNVESLGIGHAHYGEPCYATGSKDAPLKPWRPHRSLIATPASASRRSLMICSTGKTLLHVNFLGVGNQTPNRVASRIGGDVGFTCAGGWRAPPSTYHLNPLPRQAASA